MMKCVFFQGPLAQVMVVADPDLYFKKYIKKQNYLCVTTEGTICMSEECTTFLRKAGG